jgi:VanZ family protein
VILGGTSMPSSAVPQQVSSFDKVLHFTIYVPFAFLLARQFSEVTSLWRAAGFTVLIAMGFAAVDEWHQRFIPGRSTELGDWYADSLGAGVGALGGVASVRRGRSRMASSE